MDNPHKNMKRRTGRRRLEIEWSEPLGEFGSRVLGPGELQRTLRRLIEEAGGSDVETATYIEYARWE